MEEVAMEENISSIVRERRERGRECDLFSLSYQLLWHNHINTSSTKNIYFLKII